MRHNLLLSISLANRVLAQPKECYLNAYHAMAHLEKSHPDVRYVEGFAVLADFPMVIEHAWLETGAETIDPSPSFLKDIERHYVPYKTFTPAQIRTAVLETNSFPVSLAMEKAPWRDPEYRRLRAQAERATFPTSECPRRSL